MNYKFSYNLFDSQNAKHYIRICEKVNSLGDKELIIIKR